MNPYTGLLRGTSGVPRLSDVQKISGESPNWASKTAFPASDGAFHERRPNNTNAASFSLFRNTPVVPGNPPMTLIYPWPMRVTPQLQHA